MSAGLVSGYHVQHDFKDDLESSVYVLLWMTLMYSEVSDRNEVPAFLAAVLDPLSYGPRGGHCKEDFLKSRSFLKHVTFPHRPALHTLIDNLAQLFSIRYADKPSENEKQHTADLLSYIESSPTSPPSLLKAYVDSTSYVYHMRMSKLESHLPTIALFEEALSDRSNWPTNDSPVKQTFGQKRSSQPLTKTSWSTTLCMEGLNIGSDEESGQSSSEDVEEPEREYQFIDIETYLGDLSKPDNISR